MKSSWRARVAMCGLLVWASSAAASEPVQFYGLDLPQEIAGSRRGKVHDFEKTQRGLGYGAEYVRPDWTTNIYIYDRQKTSLPDDVQSDAIRGELEEAKGDVRRSAKYSRVELKREFLVRDPRGKARVSCAMFDVTTKDPARNDTFVCLSSWRHKFVKFRLSTQPRADSESAARAYLETWIRLLWPS
ncbi:MAG: hypothetical protein F9K29_02835 [Hyphomicrobiaceae bacterium]|nr:MAG: hypothetical protein F9K29_02835 [Hyphomicrobiaceae bacterium]